MTLSDLLRHLPTRAVDGDVSVEVGEVTRDSRQVRPDSVFVAVRGARVDGHDLVADLRCAAVVVEAPVAVRPGVVRVVVDDTKQALALLAAARYGHPSDAVRVVGVTGTNGKTTITTVVEGALLHLGRSAARVGTTGISVGGVARDSAFTTPEAPQLQGFLADLRDGGTGTLAMEVSSIGLAQRRVDGIRFHVAAFTNLTQDHLDFHGDMATYAAAKARLFQQLLRPPDGAHPRAILCADDPAWRAMDPPEDRWLYGFAERADVRITAARTTAAGTVLDLATPRGPGTVHSPMIGAHNAQNLACAVAILLALGESLGDACRAVGSVRGVPGRLEVVPDPGGRLVVVDYAHTPDALDHALRTVRAVTTGALWVVFGCGGDRDRAKRPQMGELASRLADHVVVTSDNPRSEAPDAIVGEIVAGARGTPIVEVDRRAAIACALAGARAGDTVLIAGKGHETYQEIAGVKHPFDDRVEAARALRGTG